MTRRPIQSAARAATTVPAMAPKADQICTCELAVGGASGSEPDHGGACCTVPQVPSSATPLRQAASSIFRSVPAPTEALGAFRPQTPGHGPSASAARRRYRTTG